MDDLGCIEKCMSMLRDSPEEEVAEAVVVVFEEVEEEHTVYSGTAVAAEVDEAAEACLVLEYNLATTMDQTVCMEAAVRLVSPAREAARGR